MRTRSLAIVALFAAALSMATGALDPRLPAAAANDLTIPMPASTDYEQTVRMQFPAERGATYRNDYHDPRDGGARVHRATDVYQARNTRVTAVAPGVVTNWMPGYNPAEETAGGGFTVQVRGDDGRLYVYSHLGPKGGHRNQAYAPGIMPGVRVRAGQFLGWLGDSGNAKRPHLHFEIRDPGVTDPYGSTHLNPFPSLRDAEKRNDYAAGGPVPVDRLAGDDRIQTGVVVSRETFRTADHVVLVAAHSIPDALSAAPIARTRNAPLLPNGTARLDPGVAEEIRRLGATDVTLVGGEAVLSAQVAADVVAQTNVGANGVRRLSGANRYTTAAAVASEVWSLTPGPKRAAIALGAHPDPGRAWPDALTAGYYGAVTRMPVLLVTSDTLPAPTSSALQGASEAVIFGGTAAVGQSVETAIDRHATTTRRLAGANRYGTAVAAAGELVDEGASLHRVWTATGQHFHDALTASPAAASRGEMFVLMDGTGSSDAPVMHWLRDRAAFIPAGRVVGDATAVTPDALQRFAATLSQ